MTLENLSPGESATVRAVRNTPVGLRLMALGFTPGAKVTCVGRAPFGRPSAYRVRRTVLALDGATAALVALETTQKPAHRSSAPGVREHHS